VCFDFLYNFDRNIFLLLKNLLDIIINTHTSSCKLPVFLPICYLNLCFLDRLLKNTQVTSSVKIRLVGPESFHADERTDRHDKVIVASRNFAQSNTRACSFPQKLTCRLILKSVSAS
jgi:hypothetical protein